MISAITFFSYLHWIDGRPLMDTIEPYRRRLLSTALDSLRPDGTPEYNFVLSGRGKKNWKSADLVLAALFCLMMRKSVQGNDCFILANDEDQAGDDLDLAKKLVQANPGPSEELEVLRKEIVRRDGLGTLRVLPAGDVAGAHGKTAAFVGFDEIHSYKNYDLFEALAPDPTRPDALTWVTSYDTIYNTPGIPLFDLKVIGRAGSDPRMLFSWYSGDYCTDPDFADLEPELRANPSIGSWPERRKYLDQQRRRLPTHKFRRLHLNLPGAPNGAFFDQAKVMSVIVSGRASLPYQDGIRYQAFVDMSGGSSDDAVLAIAHVRDGRVIIDQVANQSGGVPFKPRDAVRRFAEVLRSYGIKRVIGDNYAGRTFRDDFQDEGINYVVCPKTKSDLYEVLEPVINNGEIELLDHPKLQEQLLTLVVRGSKIDHEPNGHDDWANAVAGVVAECMQPFGQMQVSLFGPRILDGRPLPPLFEPKAEEQPKPQPGRRELSLSEMLEQELAMLRGS